ncbi:decaprenylphospho-beta-D-erythro-pentofuranosid-2-ulose 2-reductase [Streptomyces pathocidini]|uniref:Decaprenylphospho-beta-D-erythro-pentofuranosid-2-ulose 2-reductase n=1 Tax=Streptomyces pathocidini TaxID=1650571 RepID=A0ABW7ULF4_9ACTN|nr:decaprenylphospho-beta-D-erythro-pentofuranosid-2-ulose 2-reductase [Streptomyces pathocidini]
MKNAFDQPQSLLILGGASDIALAVARRMVAERTRRVVLAGRPSPALSAAAKDLRAQGAEVEEIAFDALRPETHEQVIDAAFELGDIDVVLMAFGVLGDQENDERVPMEAVRVAQVNYVGAVSAALVSSNALRRQGHGHLVVLSSVAGERARKANFIYGSTKAGLDAFAQGLGDKLANEDIHVLVVRPGFVQTKMTAGMAKAPMATTADAVAADILQGIAKRSAVVWSPSKLRPVMSVIRHLPRPVFRRLPL